MTNYDPSLDVMVQASVESLLRVANIGYAKGHVSDLQSYKAAPDLHEASLESISGVAGRVWSRVLAALRSATIWALDFVKRLFNRITGVEEGLKLLEEYQEKWRTSKNRNNKVEFPLTPEMAMFAGGRSLGESTPEIQNSMQTLFKCTFFTNEWLKKDGVDRPDFFGAGSGVNLEGLKGYAIKSISDNLAGTVFGLAWSTETNKDMIMRRPVNYSARVVSTKEAIPNKSLATEIKTTIANARLSMLVSNLKEYRKYLDKMNDAVEQATAIAQEIIKEAERKTGRAAADISDGNKAQYMKVQRCLFLMTGPSVKYYQEAVRVYASAIAGFLREVRRVPY
jgi:hypothetical protein